MSRAQIEAWEMDRVALHRELDTREALCLTMQATNDKRSVTPEKLSRAVRASTEHCEAVKAATNLRVWDVVQGETDRRLKELLTQ